MKIKFNYYWHEDYVLVMSMFS